MNEKSWPVLLARYLKEEKRGLLLLLCSVALFFIAGGLYGLEMEMLLYAAFLTLLLCVFVHGRAFLHYAYAHKLRQRTLAGIEGEWNDLPEAETLAQEDYQKMVRVLGERCAAIAAAWESERTDAQEYYTVWVHQIKTPIAVMRLLLQAEDTKENRELLTELFRIEQYVEMVLGYIRLESDTNDLVLRYVPLDGMIRGVIRKFAPQFIRKKIRLHYDGVDLRLLTDEKWFSFILEQAVSNALKYSGEGGSVTIGLSEDERYLFIEDTGIGIASEDLPRVFEKGYTGYNGREDKKATGLGLYLCKQTADKLGLRLRLTSEVRRGTKFIIEISESLEKNKKV